MTKRSWRGWLPYRSLCVRFPAAHQCRARAPLVAATYQRRAHKPDNLKSGVTLAHRYEPEINRPYAELARHYGAVVIPARVATPTDKPKVEVSVQIAQRWILAALRHRTFFTLADLNAAIRERVAAINDRPMQ